jgi:hypothetical protein
MMKKGTERWKRKRETVSLIKPAISVISLEMRVGLERTHRGTAQPRQFGVSGTQNRPGRSLVASAVSLIFAILANISSVGPSILLAISGLPPFARRFTRGFVSPALISPSAASNLNVKSQSFFANKSNNRNSISQASRV